jgi:arylsulfatase A-like enzyme
MVSLRIDARKLCGLLIVLVVIAGTVVPERTAAADRPNIVLIYADDLGYGDVSCQGATAVKTPAVDRLANEGLRFTSGYATSATCTPSRYSMLTGEYAWRQRGTGIATGDANAIIKPGRVTLASLLKEAGYTTGVVGKWHLGLGEGKVNWNEEIPAGPREIGFDYSFLIPATGDRVPCVYVENQRVVGLDPSDPIEVSFRGKIGDEPTGRENPELLKMHPSHGHDMTIVNGISRIGHMSGGHAARWKDEDMADVITDKAVKFIEKNKAEPFFLFFSFHDIHVPRVPHPRFVGQTDMGPRGDAIAQMDWCVEQILKTLDENDLAKSTLVIFSSDNGPVIDDGYKDQAVTKLGDHKPAGPLRGGKYSKFEGGTRVPFIVRWPAEVKPGTSDAIVCQIDFPASLAALAGVAVPEDAAPDSVNVLPALLGEAEEGREELVLHGNGLALRQGPWKLIPQSGGPARNSNVDVELGNAPKHFLFNLDDDVGETKNVASDHPERVEAMLARLQELQKASRSRP